MHQITSKIEISLIPMFLTASGFEENNRNLNYQKGDSETFSRWDIGIVEISISEIISSMSYICTGRPISIKLFVNTFTNVYVK